MKIEVKADWQTKARGTNQNEYEIYIQCANDGKGNDICTGEKLLTFKEWLLR